MQALRGSSAHATLQGVICTRTTSFWCVGQGNLGFKVGLGGLPFRSSLGFGGWDKGTWGLGVELGEYLSGFGGWG